MSFLSYSTFHFRISIWIWSEKSIRSYIKSKTVFKNYFLSLSKLAEQTKIHLSYDFEVWKNFRWVTCRWFFGGDTPKFFAIMWLFGRNYDIKKLRVWRISVTNRFFTNWKILSSQNTYKNWKVERRDTGDK
jgi:hypothetical protein